MKNITALLLSKSFYGKERANIEVYKLLKDSGRYNVSVIANKNADPRIIENLDGFSIAYIDYINRHNHNCNVLLLLWKLIIANVKLFKILSSDTDILFVNDETTIYDLFFGLLFFRKKIVYRIGDAPAFSRLKFRWLNSKLWHNFSVKRVTRFVYNALYVKRTLEESGRNTINDKLIYNYPPRRISNKSNDASLYHAKNKSIITFGFIGQITEEKGVGHIVDNIVTLYHKGIDCELYVAGNLDYDSSFGLSIRDKCKNIPTIHLLGEIENIELFFSHIDVLCIPSIKEEPLANTLTEAKLYSVPSIIYPSGGLPELVEHKKDGYICKSKDSGSLMEAMQHFIDNFSTIDVYKTNAYESISKLGIDKLSFERNWLNVFDRL